MAHDLLSGNTTPTNWSRYSNHSTGNDDHPIDPKPLMDWIEKRNKEIEQQAAQGDPQALKAMDRIRKNRALGQTISKIILDDLKARAAQGDSEAQRKLTEKDRLLPISKKISSDLLGEETRFWSKTALHAEYLRIIGVLDNVNRDASQALALKMLTPSEWEQWRQGYLTGHEFLTHASHWWGMNVETAHEWEQYAVKWRDFIESKGFKTTGPHTEKKEDASLTKIALVGGLAVGGAIALSQLINSVRK
jgi:hypothetical protein